MTSSPLIRPGIFNTLTTTTTTAESPSSASPIIVESDFVVILAALLCALICVIGLVAVARCAWLRRNSTTNSRTGINSSSSSSQTVGGAANKGLKKKILRSLPKLSFNDSMKQKLIDCAICLTEFVNGDEIRVLPQCNHGFHVTCIDTWLGSHSSCPSCRQILVVSRCQKCGGFPANNSGADVESEIQMKAREDDVNRFLP